MSAAKEDYSPLQDSGKVVYLLERLQKLSDQFEGRRGPSDFPVDLEINLEPAARQNAALDRPLPPGGSHPTVPPMTEPSPLIDAKVAAAEARGETRAVQLEGRIDALAAALGGRLDVTNAKIDALAGSVSASRAENFNTRWILFSTIVGAVLAIVFGYATVMSYGGDQFGRGMEIRKAVDEAVQETIKAMPKPPTALETDANKLK